MIRDKEAVNLEITEFFQKLKQHCQSNDGDCKQCCFNDFCYTAPRSLTDCMLNQSLDFLEKVAKVGD